MKRKTYKLTDFFENYSKEIDKYIIFIKINSLGRDAKDILTTLKKLQMSLEELENEVEFVIEEFNVKQEAWERYNVVKDLRFQADVWLYHHGEIVTNDSFMTAIYGN